MHLLLQTHVAMSPTFKIADVLLKYSRVPTRHTIVSRPTGAYSADSVLLCQRGHSHTLPRRPHLLPFTPPAPRKFTSLPLAPRRRAARCTLGLGLPRTAVYGCPRPGDAALIDAGNADGTGAEDDVEGRQHGQDDECEGAEQHLRYSGSAIWCCCGSAMYGVRRTKVSRTHMLSRWAVCKQHDTTAPMIDV